MPEPMSPTEFRQHLAELLDLGLGETPDHLDGLWGLIKQALTVTRTDRDRWMGVATSEQTAHAATQAALTTTREENQRLRADADHRQQLINEAHGALNTAGAPHGYPAQRIAHLLAERDHWKRAATGAEEVSAATEAENQRLRAELATLQARAAKAVAATLPACPGLPPRAEGDVRDGVMSGAEADATARADAAERKLARARRIVHRLVELHIDDTGR